MTRVSAADVASALRARSGFAAEAVATERVASYLALRARELGLADACDAAARVLSVPAEYARIEAHFAPPETWLFRYAESFEHLRAFARARAARGVRALVVGAGGWCEPCSVAAALLDGVGDARAAGVSVEAVDRNGEVFARAPLFRAMECRGGVPAFAARFFVQEGDALRPVDAVMRAIDARAQSAEACVEACLEACARRGARYDAVFFRNVAIYLDEPRRRALIAGLAGLLADDGELFVGHAEVSAAAAASGLVSTGDAGAFALVRAQNAAPMPRPAAGATPRAAAPAPAQPSRAPVRADESGAPLDEASRARAAIALRPTDASAHAALAAILAGQGDLAGAREAADRALYLDRFHEEALVLAARLAAARGEHAAADHLRERAMRAHLARIRAEGGA